MLGRIKVLLLVTFFSIYLSSYAEAGKLTGAFFDPGFGARAKSLGGAFVALADDASSLFWNPSGLIDQRERRSLFFGYLLHKGLVPFHFIAYIDPFLHEDHVFGCALLTSGDKVLRENTIYFSCARSFIHILGVGVNLKLRHATYGKDSRGSPERIRGDCVGIGVDLGCILKFSRRFRLGVFLRDLVAPVWWKPEGRESYTESVPLGVILGLYYDYLWDIGISMAFENWRILSVGYEKRILSEFKLKRNRLFDGLDIRLGYRQDLKFERGREYFVGLGIASMNLKYNPSFDFVLCFEVLAMSVCGSLSLQF